MDQRGHARCMPRCRSCGSGCATPRALAALGRGGSLRGSSRSAWRRQRRRSRSVARGRRRAPRPGDGQLDFFAALPPALARECRRAERLIRRLCALERDARTLHGAGDRGGGGARARGRPGAHAARSHRCHRGRPARSRLQERASRQPDWYGERPTHPQLLAYLGALGDEVVGLATVNVTMREVRFCGVAALAAAAAA